MQDLANNPIVTQLDESMLEGVGAFPNKLFLIQCGEGLYAANNITLPDGQTVDGLATFPDPDEATTYTGLLAGLNGEIVGKTFEEARQIAISKPRLMCMLLFLGAKVVDVHWVR